MKINLAQQQVFFDQAEHRVETEIVLNPSLAQVLEYHQLLKPLAQLDPKNSQIIEMGSGSGRLTFELLKKGFNVIAYDVSQASLKNLALNYQKFKLATWGQLSVTDQLPKNNSADAILGCDILHHVPLPEVLPKWKKLLKPDGIAIFSEPNALNLLWYGHLMLQGIPWEIEKGILQCWPANLKRLFLTAGFNNCQIYGHGLFPTLLPFPKKFAEKNAFTWAKNWPNLAFRLQIIARLN